MTKFADDVQTGDAGYRPSLPIVGRPKQGQVESWVLLEEPAAPVQMHWHHERNMLVPHYKSRCPNCCEQADPEKPFWYIGATSHAHRGQVGIIELAWKCFQTVSAAARDRPVVDDDDLDLFGESAEDASPVFQGLLVEVRRQDFVRSPRVLRCTQRFKVTAKWPYDTRRELARIWGVPIRPRLFRQEGGAS